MGRQHLFVDGVRGHGETQYQVRTTSGDSYAALHLPQPDEGTWCGPWSLLQAVLVLCRWPRDRVVNPDTRREPLRTFWSRVRELYADGMFETDIEELAAVLAPAISVKVTVTDSAKRVGRIAAAAIREGHVPLVRFSSRSWSHYSACIGCEVEDGSLHATALLLLDPNAPSPWATFYGARLELVAEARPQQPFPLRLRYLNGDTWRARIDSVVVVKRGDDRLEQP